MVSQVGAVVDEDTYVISFQRRSLLIRKACETLNRVKLVAVESVETADYYRDNNPQLFGGLGRMSCGDYSIQLREDAVPFAFPTPRRVSINGCRQAGATEDGRYSSDQPYGHTYGLVCGYGRRGQAQSSLSYRRWKKMETHKVRICVDLTKLNESVMTENMAYHPSTKRLVGWR